MKSVHFASCAFMLIFCSVAYAQSPDKTVAASDGQKAWELMKTLVGNWQGPVSTDNPAWSTDKPVSISLRVASHGNALVHELNTGTPELTVLYLDSDRVTLIHYCDFGNRPHLVARPLTRKTLEFDLVDFSGSNEIGHVHQAGFTFVDADRHIEDWTFMLPGDKPMHVHIDLKRVQ